MSLIVPCSSAAAATLSPCRPPRWMQTPIAHMQTPPVARVWFERADQAELLTLTLWHSIKTVVRKTAQKHAEPHGIQDSTLPSSGRLASWVTKLKLPVCPQRMK